MITRKNLLMCVALLLTAAMMSGTLPAFAQTAAVPQQQQGATEEFRRQAPTPLPARPLNLPAPYETTLPNGLRVVIVEDKRTPLVSYRLAFRTGDARDPKELPGLSDMMTGLLTEGTTTRTSRQIADEVARLGATLSAGSNADYTTVAASALSTYGDQILDLMADVALRPSFPQNEVDLTKQNTKQSLVLQRGQASFLASERISRVIFGEHPYAVISTNAGAVDKISREQLTNFHRQTFAPNNAVLVVVGDVQRAALMNRINTLFGSWAKSQTTTASFPALPVRTARAIYVVDRPGSAQSNIVIANAAITRTSPDYFPALLMHTILGASGSARLFMNLRESKGYTYGAYSNLDARREAGSFRSTAEVRTPVTGDSLKEFFYELNRIRNEAVTDKELADAKSYLTGVFPIRLETQEGLVDQLVQIKMFGLQDDYLQTYRDRVTRVTKEDVQRAAQRYVTPDKVAIVIVGDAAAISNQIKPYADTIELYDTQGNRKEMTAPATTNATMNTTNGGSMTIESPTTGVAANIVGSWTLEVSLPNGQTLPATLVVKQDAGKTTGELQSQMANFTFSSINLNGNTFDGAFSMQMQGQTMEGKMTGRVQADKMDGTITVNTPGLPPLSFTGTRAKQ
ncbi:MAG: pitrilysin family protein [Pyrinomonadaceae bacterium]